MCGARVLSSVLDFWLDKTLLKWGDFKRRSLFIDFSIKPLELSASLAKLKNYTLVVGEIEFNIYKWISTAFEKLKLSIAKIIFDILCNSITDVWSLKATDVF